METGLIVASMMLFAPLGPVDEPTRHDPQTIESSFSVAHAETHYQVFLNVYGLPDTDPYRELVATCQHADMNEFFESPLNLSLFCDGKMLVLDTDAEGLRLTSDDGLVLAAIPLESGPYWINGMPVMIEDAEDALSR